jgi:hypothetical protein
LFPIMTAKSLPFANVAKQSLHELVLALDPVAEALASGWVKYKWRKIGPTEIVLAFLSVMLSSGASYSRLARKVGIPSLVTVSRQAVQKRMNKSFIAYMNRLVSKALANGMREIVEKDGIGNSLFGSFTSVSLHDSSCVPLPDALADHFPGASNGRGPKKAMLKIDTMLDIKHWRLRRLKVNPYRKNDQSQAVEGLEGLGKGSLVVRDLGYFVCDAFHVIDAKKAFFLSRLKYGVNLYDDSGQPVELDKLLKNGQTLDRWFLMGGKNPLRVRLVAIPLPPKEAAERRRKARNDRDRRIKHTDDYMHRLGWTILITNVVEETWSTAQVVEAYRFRWFVETLFKSWKSNFNLAGQPCPKKSKKPYKREPKHPYKAEALVLASLLLTVLVQMPLMAHFLVAKPAKDGEPEVSMLQVARMVADHCIDATAEEMAFIVGSMPYFCKNDKRKRPSAASKLTQRTA